MRIIHGTFGTPIYFEGEGGGGGGGNPDPKPDPEPKKDEPKTVLQSDVDNIVKQRVEETRRKAESDLAEALGVTIDEAKAIVKASKDAEEAEKSEAQKAREAADKEKVEAETAKSASATAIHQANLERAILRALPKDLDDDTTDKKVERIAKIVEVEVGADAETIKAAVKALKDEDPTMFNAAPDPKKKIPPSDPKGGAPKKVAKSEDAFTAGQERAKAMAGKSARPAFDGT